MDTGATYTTWPSDRLERLGVRAEEEWPFVLADVPFGGAGRINYQIDELAPCGGIKWLGTPWSFREWRGNNNKV